MVEHMEVLKSDELTDFDRLHKEYFVNNFPLPEIKNIAAGRVVKDENGVVIASGFIKLFSEAIIVTDLKRAEITRVRALDLLVADLLSWCNEHGVEQIHAFTDSKFSRVLMHRYGFDIVKAVPLVLNLE